MSGVGVTGQTTVPITAGFTGSLDVGVTGLAKAQSFPGTSADITVAATDSQFFCVQVAARSEAARFTLDAANDAADMDLFVYSAADAACEQLTDVAGQSATGTADEQVTLLGPEPGFYLVEVDPFAAAPGEPTLSWRLDFYDVGPANQAGSFRQCPTRCRSPTTGPRRSRPSGRAWTPTRATWACSSTPGRCQPTFVSVDTVLELRRLGLSGAVLRRSS